MRYINVHDDFIRGIFKANNLNESQEVETAPEKENVESIEETQEEGHACPLCESALESPISEEALQECVDSILEAVSGQLLSEEEAVEEDTDSEEDNDELDDLKKAK